MMLLQALHTLSKKSQKSKILLWADPVMLHSTCCELFLSTEHLSPAFQLYQTVGSSLLAKGSSHEGLLQPIPTARLLPSCVFSYLIWGFILLPRMPGRNSGWLQRCCSPWPFCWKPSLCSPEAPPADECTSKVFSAIATMQECLQPPGTQWSSWRDGVCAAGTTLGPRPQDCAKAPPPGMFGTRVDPHFRVDTAKVRSGPRLQENQPCAWNNLDAKYFCLTDARALAWGSEDSRVPEKLFKW